MNAIKFKQTSFDVKDFDESKGVVVAYANAYDFKDSDGDISAKGSFEKSVNENFKRIRVLKDHNQRISLGVPLDINTKDDYGLLTTTKFNLSKEVSRDMFSDIKLMTENGLNAELSIGYNVLNRDQKNKSIITEYKLMEYSFLTSWGANQLSTVQDVKSIKGHYGILELIEKSYDLEYSDTRLKQIETLLKTLSHKEPSDTIDTPNDKPLEKIDFATLINNYTKTIK
jgi:HK97 family phage prohead protease